MFIKENSKAKGGNVNVKKIGKRNCINKLTRKINDEIHVLPKTLNYNSIKI